MLVSDLVFLVEFCGCPCPLCILDKYGGHGVAGRECFSRLGCGSKKWRWARRKCYKQCGTELWELGLHQEVESPGNVCRMGRNTPASCWYRTLRETGEIVMEDRG